MEKKYIIIGGVTIFIVIIIILLVTSKSKNPKPEEENPEIIIQDQVPQEYIDTLINIDNYVKAQNKNEKQKFLLEVASNKNKKLNEKRELLTEQMNTLEESIDELSGSNSNITEYILSTVSEHFPDITVDITVDNIGDNIVDINFFITEKLTELDNKLSSLIEQTNTCTTDSTAIIKENTRLSSELNDLQREFETAKAENIRLNSEKATFNNNIEKIAAYTNLINTFAASTNLKQRIKDAGVVFDLKTLPQL